MATFVTYTDAEIEDALLLIGKYNPQAAGDAAKAIDQARRSRDTARFDAYADQVMEAAAVIREREAAARARTRPAARETPDESHDADQPAREAPRRPVASPRRTSTTWIDRLPELLGKIAIVMLVIAFGLVFFAINGGFSVLGAAAIAGMFNETGKVAWLFLASWTFTIPIPVPVLAAQQPVLPWIGVSASSLLQVAIIWLRLSKRRIPMWMYIFGTIMSFYDYGTTYFGLQTVSWIKAAGAAGQIPVAAVLTFGLELTIGFILPRVRR